MDKAKDYAEEYVQINGIEQYFLHYPASHPCKSVIIHLHGGPGSSAVVFAYVMTQYRDICNIIFYDQRGAGRTQRRNKTKPEEITLENMIADLKHTISYIKKKYETDRIILMGQSWGTILGTQYVLRYPEDVVCFIGTGCSICGRRELKVIYDKLKYEIGAKGSKRDMKKLISLGDYPNISVKDKDYARKEIKMFLLRTKYGLTLRTGKLLKIMLKSPIFRLSDIIMMLKGPKVNIELMKTMVDYSVWDDVDYSVPVYYLLGRDDWQVPSTIAAEYFERINAPKKKLYWIENAGHATDVDNPVDYCAAVKDILGQV